MIEITILAAVIIVVVLNTILDHLFNWWIREWDDDSCIVVISVYMFKFVILFGILFEILK